MNIGIGVCGLNRDYDKPSLKGYLDQHILSIC